MGLFTKKKKITVADMSMQMMMAASDVIGKIKAFNDVDDVHNMEVSMGYFYGFLRLHLNSISNFDTANSIVHQSISHLEKATIGKPAFADFGLKVRTLANGATENMQYVLKETNDPFMGMAVFYLKDLYNSTTLDMSKVEIAEKNMKYLYGITSDLTKDIKIVK